MKPELVEQQAYRSGSVRLSKKEQFQQQVLRDTEQQPPARRSGP